MTSMLPARDPRQSSRTLHRAAPVLQKLAIIGALCATMALLTARAMQRDYFDADPFTIFRPWRARLFTNLLASSVVPLEIWGALFFALICLVYLLDEYESSLPMILGTFAVISFTYALPDPLGAKAWDLPAVLIFSVLCLGMRRASPLLIGAASVVGTGFKETAALGTVLLLFLPNTPMRSRIRYFAFTLLLVGVLRATIELVVGNPLFGSLEVMEQDTGSFFTQFSRSHLHWNLGYLRAHPLYPLTLNAGTLFALFLVRDRPHARAWQTVALLFLAGNFLAGRISEPRIFLELTPPALWLLFRRPEAIGRPGSAYAVGLPSE